MAAKTRRPPSWHQMHYNKDVKGVWSGSGRDLKAECGQIEQIVVTSVREAVGLPEVPSLYGAVAYLSE